MLSAARCSSTEFRNSRNMYNYSIRPKCVQQYDENFQQSVLSSFRLNCCELTYWAIGQDKITVTRQGKNFLQFLHTLFLLFLCDSFTITFENYIHLLYCEIHSTRKHDHHIRTYRVFLKHIPILQRVSLQIILSKKVPINIGPLEFCF